MNSPNNSILKLSLLLTLVLFAFVSFADGGLNTYYKVGDYKGSVSDAAKSVKAALTTSDNPFEIIGEYSPARDSKMQVITFTRKDLVDICLQVPDKGILASILKVGIIETAPGTVEISLLNPDYIFYAFLRDAVDKHATELSGISMDVRIALINVGRMFFPFGGGANEMELKHFKFTTKMPGFDDAIVVGKFSSFDAAVEKLSLSLRARKNTTIQVYKQVYKSQQVAIFGVGMFDQRMGENTILAKLPKTHLAAFPYEVIIQGNTAYILPARYRLPLFWSNRTIRDHQRLYKTPRHIEETMKSLTK